MSDEQKKSFAEKFGPNKRPKLSDFDEVLAELAHAVVEHAQKLPKGQFDLKLDAFKAATAYKSVLNRAPEGDEGRAIQDIRDQLTQPPPKIESPDDEEQEDGGPEDS